MAAKPQKPADPSDIELRPDGWERFETAVDAATRAPARRRASPKLPPEFSVGLSDVVATVPEPMRLVMRTNSQALDELTKIARGSR